MSITIRPAQPSEAQSIVELVNRFAAENIMLPRTELEVRATVNDWLVAVEEVPTPDGVPLLGCGALVPLSESLVELRSLAIQEGQQGRGIGSSLVLALVDYARMREFDEICALTLREDFFIRLGFELIDRWSISPKIWQACIYCPKFHRCDEVAVTMKLKQPADSSQSTNGTHKEGWKDLMKWKAWQPLRLAYQQKPIAKQTNLQSGAKIGDSDSRT